jgi:Flp pilus assembly protein protease CpaA
MEILILTLVFIYLVIATISDIRTTEIPDFLNFSFIAIGIFIYAIKTLTTSDSTYLLYSLLTVGAFFILGIIMYYTKQWGGADSKLLMGLGALIPLYPQILLNNFTLKTSKFLGLDLFINLLMVGALYALLFLIYLIIKNRKKFVKEFKKMHSKKELRILEKIIWITIIGINILNFFLSHSILQRNFIFTISILLLLFNYLTVSVKAIENISMYITIPTTKLRVGDYITKELKSNNKLIFKPIVHGVDEKQILEIQKHFKQVEIKEGIVFAPVFLIATIITLFFGNIVFYFLP